MTDLSRTIYISSDKCFFSHGKDKKKEKSLLKKSMELS